MSGDRRARDGLRRRSAAAARDDVVRGAPCVLHRLPHVRRADPVDVRARCASHRRRASRARARGAVARVPRLAAHMTAYKFLAADGTAIQSRFRWPVGEWVEAEVDPCRSGIHACRVSDLPYWLAPVLFEIELGGDVVVDGLKIVAPRGRLTRRVDAWNAELQEA